MQIPHNGEIPADGSPCSQQKLRRNLRPGAPGLLAGGIHNHSFISVFGQPSCKRDGCLPVDAALRFCELPWFCHRINAWPALPCPEFVNGFPRIRACVILIREHGKREHASHDAVASSTLYGAKESWRLPPAGRRLFRGFAARSRADDCGARAAFSITIVFPGWLRQRLFQQHLPCVPAPIHESPLPSFAWLGTRLEQRPLLQYRKGRQVN